jgi:cytochrome P450
MRRAALLPYFSPSHVRKLQPAFQEILDVLLKRLLDLKDTDEPVNANCVFAAFSNDMTHILAFGDSQHKLGESLVQRIQVDKLTLEFRNPRL